MLVGVLLLVYVVVCWCVLVCVGVGLCEYVNDVCVGMCVRIVV